MNDPKPEKLSTANLRAARDHVFVALRAVLTEYDLTARDIDEIVKDFRASLAGIQKAPSLARVRAREEAKLTFDERVERNRAKYAAEQGPMICGLCKKPITEGQAHMAGLTHWECYEASKA